MAVPKILLLDKDNGVAQVGNVAMQVRGGTHTMATLTAVATAAKSVFKGHPTGGGLLVLLEETAGILPKDVREAQTAVMKDFMSSTMVRCAIVIPGESVSASMQRAVAVGTRMQASKNIQLAAATPREGFVWLRSELSSMNPAATPSLADLEGGLDFLRRRYAAKRLEMEKP